MADELKWFPFEWREFVISTEDWTNEQVGAYLRLLVRQFHRGSITPRDVAAVGLRDEQDGTTAWVVNEKFITRDDGQTFVNLKMERVRDDAIDLHERKSAGAKNSAKVRRQRSRQNGVHSGLQMDSTGSRDCLHDTPTPTVTPTGTGTPTGTPTPTPTENQSSSVPEDSGPHKSTEASAVDSVMDELVNAWNERVEATGDRRMKKIRKLTRDRKQKLRQRLAEAEFRDCWRDAIAQLPNPVRGDFDWTPDFNWFIRGPSNAVRIAEGEFNIRRGDVEASEAIDTIGGFVNGR